MYFPPFLLSLRLFKQFKCCILQSSILNFEATFLPPLNFSRTSKLYILFLLFWQSLFSLLAHFCSAPLPLLSAHSDILFGPWPIGWDSMGRPSLPFPPRSRFSTYFSHPHSLSFPPLCHTHGLKRRGTSQKDPTKKKRGGGRKKSCISVEREAA